ncbi:hypothetical protein [Salinibius halmophilus]|uniref:hypothetical protein n=1 Tax=Salinibius halmophilus TaxID=1853216 RepID=UPI000E66795A|nr:hypothetical protein [Salinibius halmophilus]
MLIVLFTFVLLVLVVGGIVIAKVATQEEEQQNAKLSTVRAYHLRLQEMIETFGIIREYCGRQAIASAIVEEMQYVVNLWLNLDAEAESENLTYWQQRLEQLREEIANDEDILETEPLHAPESERETAKLRKHVGRTLRMISKLAEQGGITGAQANEYKTFLRTLMLRCEVQSFLRIGDNHEAMGDRLKAAAYYKHAKEVLIASELEFEGKSDKIKEIAKQVSGVYQSHREEEMKKEADQIIVEALMEEDARMQQGKPPGS